MWSPNLRRVRRALAVALTLGLAGCAVRPLYGEAPSGGKVQDKLAAIALSESPGLLGHYLVEELRFDLNGSGAPTKALYRLDISVTETVTTAIVSSVTGRASSANVNGTADYTLVAVGTGAKLVAGRATATASYDRTDQRFAAVRAARDTEIRVAQALSEDIRTRLAAYFATTP